MYNRFLSEQIVESLHDCPVVLLNGARQTGKSTLAQHLLEQGHVDKYLSLDDLTVLAAARSDPVGFIEALEGRVVIDEVQRAPELFLPIKARVDRTGERGRFLLTGSANVMVLPRLSDALTGRLAIHTLGPLTQDELSRRPAAFLDALFADRARWVASDQEPVRGLLARVVRGGFPEALARTRPRRRQAWFEGYLTTLVQRDIRDVAQIEGTTDIPRLLRLLAARVGGLMNFAHLSRDCGLPQSTLKRYLTHLQALFLLELLPAWSANVKRRLVRAPKVHLVDSGLAAHLLGRDRLDTTHHLTGALLESFVHGELRRQAGWHLRQLHFSHFRTHGNREVDIVIEAMDGTLAGVEVKLGAVVRSDDLEGLKTLRDVAPQRFIRGVVLYGGGQVVPLGGDLTAVPLSALWTGSD